MKIKTVCKKVCAEGTAAFDQEVNELLADGWLLSKREFIPGYDLGGGIYFSPSYYAELVKLEEADKLPQEPEPITWEEAVWVLRETCQEAKECGVACPMYAWCQKSIPGNNCPPCGWVSPEELDPAE